MINYILQIVLFQALFLAVYDFFLQKETFFKWNRFYLLLTPILSFIIPLLKFESVQKAVPKAYIEQLPTVFLNPQIVIEQTTQSGSTLNYLAIAFYAGLSIFTFLFLIKLRKIFQLISSNKVLKKENFSLVLLENKQSAFSFFNYIFVHKHLLENEDLHIIKHELIHCKQKHTLDLLLFEVLKIVFWFNPMIYVYQKRITVLHEYISDAEVVNETDKNTYFNKLLAETFNVENISFINQFFKHSLIKKRIVMITKEKSQKMKQLKYLLIVPLLLGMLIYSSCTDAAKDELLEMESILQQNEEITEGKYFDTKDGKVFVGKNLAGTVVHIDDYSDDEKEMYNKTSSIENSIFEFLVVIDNNGDRIKFLRTNKNADTYKNNWEYVKGEDVPFAKIEIVPIFPGCEGTNEELRKCLQEKITAHVSANFNSKLASGLGLEPGIKRIFVLFIIDKEGNITGVKSRAPHKALEEEAIRVVNSIPQMTPGSYLGENVGVKYSLPIAFKVEGDAKNSDNNVDKYKEGDDLPFAIIDEVPIYPGCEGDKSQLRNCIQEKITAHVSANFNSKMAKELGLKPGVKRIFVMFKIDKEGNITDVKSRAPHIALQDEAIRVINLLPQMIPGKQKGDAVGVMYSLPIAFKVE